MHEDTDDLIDRFDELSSAGERPARLRKRKADAAVVIEDLHDNLDHLDAELCRSSTNLQTELNHGVQQDEMILGRLESIETLLFHLKKRVEQMTKNISQFTALSVAEFIQLQKLGYTVTILTTKMSGLLSQFHGFHRRLMPCKWPRLRVYLQTYADHPYLY